MLPLGILALLGGAGIGGLMGGGKGALLGGALGAGAGYGIPAAMGMGASATPALSPGLMEMAGAATPAGVTAMTAVPAATETSKGIMPYLGLGASTISPVAGAMLGRQPQEYPSATPTNVGAKPGWDVGNFYPPPRQRMPTSLARLLMGIR